MLLGVVELPHALRAGHDVEIVEVIAMDGGAGVIALGHHDDIAVFHRSAKRAARSLPGSVLATVWFKILAV